MRVSHAAAGRDAVFNDPNLVSCGELDRSKTTPPGSRAARAAREFRARPRPPGGKSELS